jgi:hypothetical protein
MRTTLNLDDRIVAAAKRHAARDGTTLTAVIDTALRQYLAAQRPVPAGFKLEVKVKKTRALPGIDLEDRAALYEILEGRR